MEEAAEISRLKFSVRRFTVIMSLLCIIMMVFFAVTFFTLKTQKEKVEGNGFVEIQGGDNIKIEEIQGENDTRVLKLSIEGGEDSGLNADFLDSNDSTYYLDISNIEDGTLSEEYYSSYSDLESEEKIGTDSDDLLTKDIADVLYSSDGGTTLTEAQVENYITNGAINLAGGSQVNGQNIASQNWVTGQGYLSTTTNFGGDVSGTYSAISVTDDSHTHTAATLPAGTSYLGSSIESAEITNGTILLEDINQNGCGDGQVIKWNVGSSAWVCANDGGGTTYSASGEGIELVVSTFSLELDGSTLSKSAAGLKVADSYDDNFLTTSTSFGGDVSGTYGAIAVTDDSHSHTAATLPGTVSYLGSAIETGEITNGTILFADIAQNTCTDGQIIKWNNGTSAWICGSDNNTTYSASGEGIELVGSTFSLELDGSTLSKGVSGLKITDTYDDNFLTTSTSFGGDVSGTYSAIAVTDDSHSHTAGTLPGTVSYLGATIETGEITNGTILFADIAQNTCTDGQIIKWDNGTSAWICGSDNNTTYTASGEGIELVGSTFSLELDGSTLSKGVSGLKITDTYDDSFLTTSTSFGGDVSGTYSAIAVTDDSHAHTAGTLPGTVSYLGSTIETGEITNGTILFADINQNACADDEIMKWDNGTSAWICSADAGGTTYSASGEGIELVGSTFSLELDGSTLSKGVSGLKITDTYDDSFLTTSTSFGGDVSGTYSAIAVTDDSHAHTAGTLPGTVSYLGSTIETGEITNGTILFADINQNACADDEIMKWDNGTSAWICSTDLSGGSSYWSKATTNLSPATAGDDVLLNTGETLTISDLTSGSLLFAGASGLVSQDNTKLFWDNSSNFLGIGTNAPSTALDVLGAFNMGGIAAPGLSAAGGGRIYFDSTANKFKISENGGPYVNLIDNPSSVCQGRLTLTSGTPVTTSDVSAATTLYFTPYKGDLISLYSSSTWQVISFTEKSLDISAYTADKNYDIFGYLSSGALVIEGLVWTDDTTRATDIATQNGVYVKSGDATRRYLGTIRITGTTGQSEDSSTKKFVWNYYNRVQKRLYRADGTSHAYTTGAYRYWNNSSTHNLYFVVGVLEDTASFSTRGEYESSAGARLGLGLNTTSSHNNAFTSTYVDTNQTHSSTSYSYPRLGYNYVSVLEYGATNGQYWNYYVWVDVLN